LEKCRKATRWLPTLHLCEEDKAENELSVAQGYRILSAYTLTTGIKIWLISEADRSATTILLPSEY
jgi:hypothetical protein